MSEVENQPVDVSAAEPAQAEETSGGVDTKATTNALKKVDKKSMLAKLKAIIKKVLPHKKVAAVGTTGEPTAEAAPVEPETAPTTTAAA
jgi:hypothetical protein